MSFVSNILPAAVALAAFASAQKGCSATGTLTVTNTAQLASISACSTYSGSIAIATGAGAIALDGPSRIAGDLVAVPNGQLGSFEASDIETIDGTLSFDTLQMFSSLSMPSLRSVNELYLSTLGQNFLNLDFGSTGLTQVSNLTVDSTYLQSLGGINLTSAGAITITNNQLLTSLIMPLSNTSGDIIIRGNTNGLSVNLNNLKSTNNFYINSVTTLALDSLSSVFGTFSLIGTSAQSLLLPNLTKATGFTVQNNEQLTNVSISALTLVQSININDNSELVETLEFSSLTQALGAVNITGALAGLSLPELKKVNGTFYVRSTNSSFQSSCDYFNSHTSEFSGSGPDCAVLAQASTSPTPSGSGTGSGSTSTPNAGVGFDVPATPITIFSALAAILGLML